MDASAVWCPPVLKGCPIVMLSLVRNTLDYNDHINLPHKDPLWEIFPGVSFRKFVVPCASLCPAPKDRGEYFLYNVGEREKERKGERGLLVVTWDGVDVDGHLVVNVLSVATLGQRPVTFWWKLFQLLTDECLLVLLISIHMKQLELLFIHTVFELSAGLVDLLVAAAGASGGHHQREWEREEVEVARHG